MTSDQKVFIIENRLELRSRELAEEIGVSTAVVTEYMRVFEIKPHEELIKKWKSETRNLRKKNKSRSNTMDLMIEFAKELGYRNFSEARKELGAKEFKKQFNQSSYAI